MNVKYVEKSKERVARDTLTEWMLMCRHRKRLHNEAYKYYKMYTDTSILSAIILGSTSAILNIGLGAIEPISFVAVNIAQISLGGAVGLTSTAIITASKQLEFEKNALEHLEHAGKYSEIHMIQAELVLLRMNDSSFASNTDFMKAIQHEIDRIEESAPSIPGFIEAKIGLKYNVSPS